MLILSLAAVARTPVRLQGQILPDDPIWAATELVLKEPLRVDLEARAVGEGVLVRGDFEAELEAACRRCLTPVQVRVRDEVSLLYEPLTPEEADELAGEVYPIPARGDALDLAPAIREQLLLRMPDYVLCSDECQGLCPECGAELNQGKCGCVPVEDDSPWKALRNIEFD